MVKDDTAQGSLTHSSPSVCTLDVYRDSTSTPQDNPFSEQSIGSKVNFFQIEGTLEASAAHVQLQDSATFLNSLEGSVDQGKKKKKKKKKLLGRSKSARKSRGEFVELFDVEVEATPNASTPSLLCEEGGVKEGKKKKKKKKEKKKEKTLSSSEVKEELEKELVLVRTQSTSYASQLEDKTWECKQAMLRVDMLLMETKEYRSHLSLLQAKVGY